MKEIRQTAADSVSTSTATSTTTKVSLEDFSLELRFPASASTLSLDFGGLKDATRTFLSDYLRKQWDANESESDVLLLSEEEIAALDAAAPEDVELRIAGYTSSGIRKRRRRRRRLEDQSPKTVTVTFQGFASVVVAATSGALTPLQTERVELLLETRVRTLQRAALEKDRYGLLFLLRQQKGVLGEISSMRVNLVEDDEGANGADGGGSRDVVGGNEVVADDASNLFGDETNDANASVTGADGNNKNNSNNNTVIILSVAASLSTLLMVLMGVMYCRKKHVPVGKYKDQTSATHDTSNDERCGIDIVVSSNSNRSSSNNPGGLHGDDDSRFGNSPYRGRSGRDFDDVSSIGMGTAITSFRKRHGKYLGNDDDDDDTNKDEDAASQASFGFSVEAQSVHTKALPKYARSDHSDDDDDTQEPDLFRGVVRFQDGIANSWARWVQNNKTPAATSKRKTNHAADGNSSVHTKDDDTVWTYAHMGTQKQTPRNGGRKSGDEESSQRTNEGIEVEALAAPRRSLDDILLDNMGADVMGDGMSVVTYDTMNSRPLSAAVAAVAKIREARNTAATLSENGDDDDLRESSRSTLTSEEDEGEEVTMSVVDAIAPVKTSHEDFSGKTNIVSAAINKNNIGNAAANIDKDVSEPLDLSRNYSLESIDKPLRSKWQSRQLPKQQPQPQQGHTTTTTSTVTPVAKKDDADDQHHAPVDLARNTSLGEASLESIDRPLKARWRGKIGIPRVLSKQKQQPHKRPVAAAAAEQDDDEEDNIVVPDDVGDRRLVPKGSVGSPWRVPPPLASGNQTPVFPVDETNEYDDDHSDAPSDEQTLPDDKQNANRQQRQRNIHNNNNNVSLEREVSGLVDHHDDGAILEDLNILDSVLRQRGADRRRSQSRGGVRGGRGAIAGRR